MKKKLLLIYPEFPTTYWSLKYALPFIKKKGMIPPLGLLTIASLIPEHYELTLIDMNIRQLSDEDIINSDLIFISAMLVQKKSFDRIVDLSKKFNKTVVAGGPYPSSSHESIKKVDHFILNEAEPVLSDFFHDYENGTAKKIYESKIKPDISEIPPPRFDLINVNDYNNMALQYSRGCPYNCEFCDIIEMFGRKPRTKLPEKFINEIETVYKTGFRGSLFIVDDNFIGNRHGVKILLKQIIEWQEMRNRPFKLFTEASIDMAGDDELLSLMERAGFDMVFIGIETPDRETLLSTGKKQNAKADLKESIKKIQKHGIEVTAGFIVGFDSDKEDIFERQIAFIQNAGIPVAMVGLLLALPNTMLYRRLKKENRILSNSTGNNTHDFDINFIPVMKRDILIDGYKKIISKIYSPKYYFRRCILLLKRFPQKKAGGNSLEINNIRAFFLSIIKQGFSSYGFYYIKYLLNVLISKPSRFGDAVSLSVKGYHFFKITREIMAYGEFTDHLKHAFESIQGKIKSLSEKPGDYFINEFNTHAGSLLFKLKKRYKKLGKEFQKNQYDKIIEFEEYCLKIIRDYTDIIIKTEQALQ